MNEAHDIFLKRENLLEILKEFEKIKSPFIKTGGDYSEVFADGLAIGFNEGLHLARRAVLVMLEEMWKKEPEK